MPTKLNGKDAVLIHFIMPKGLIERFDAYCKEHDYGTRTEAMRDLIRRAIDGNEQEPKVIRRPRRVQELKS